VAGSSEPRRWGAILTWPVFFDSDGPRPLQDLTVDADTMASGVRATFRVNAGDRIDDTWLSCTETLRGGTDGSWRRR